eukprot:3377984-Karenia_brevis.AAC.1
MRIQEWPAPSNKPTLGIQLEFQTIPEIDTANADHVWQQGQVTVDIVPPPRSTKRTWHPTYNMTMSEMVEIAGLTIHQPNQSMGNEQHKGSEGLGAMPHTPRDWGIRLSDQEWSLGPD